MGEQEFQRLWHRLIMSAQDMAALAVAATTVIGSFIGSVRWLVKHYLSELKPNSGSSLKDEVTALSARVETILRILEK
jgi:hypothetical protein